MWSPVWFKSGFFLGFVEENKRKVAYAASMGVNVLTEKQKQMIIPLIEKFDFISVRENTVKQILEQNIDLPIKVVVDPVLLLKEEEWDIIAKEILKNTNYIYTYFLDDNVEQRNKTDDISSKLQLPIATIPYVGMSYNTAEEMWGDLKVNDVGPCEFLGLIKYSDIVITDSFHAVVFSIIFKKNFRVFLRGNSNHPQSMNSRIIDLLEFLELDYLVISTDESCEVMELDKEISYDKIYERLDLLKKTSFDFLKEALANITEV